MGLRLRLDRAYRQVREYMGLQQRRQKVHYDKLCKGKPFKVGDMVWLHCPAVPRGKSPISSIVIGKGLTSYIRYSAIFFIKFNIGTTY